MTNMTVLAQFLRDEAGSSGDSYMQAADVVDKHEKLQTLITKHGICSDCGEMYQHDLDAPFASCKCKQSEWYRLTPYMELEKVAKLHHKEKLLLAAENAHLRTLLVGLIKPELQIHAPSNSAIDYAEIQAKRNIDYMLPTTEKVLDEIRADQLRSVLNAKCPVTGPILDAVARGYVIDIIDLLEK